MREQGIPRCLCLSFSNLWLGTGLSSGLYLMTITAAPRLKGTLHPRSKKAGRGSEVASQEKTTEAMTTPKPYPCWTELL